MKKTNGPAALAGHAGYLSPRYSKGQRTADALLESGRRLLRTRPLEAMSIQDLCAQAEVTTGAFYGRFRGKDAFFAALQKLAVEDIRQASQRRLAELDEGDWTLDDTLAVLVRNTRLWVLRHEGVLRATLLQHQDEAAGWAPFRRMTHEFVEGLVPRIERLMGADAPDAQARRLHIRFGFQMMFGTIVNAAINNPGPLTLSDRRMDTELSQALCLYLRVQTVRTNHARTPPR
ncbi:MAG: TetR/AcrR family transcriptional regulator [Proteobacteria bacterium]|nr:TetR/AcrR family transcriptional regulator [Pseudomonadota bacterium]